MNLSALVLLLALPLVPAFAADTGPAAPPQDKTRGWSRNIDKLDGDERAKLAALIEAAQVRR